nr:hypothetical protein FNV92_10905 [Bradyrhizobium cosmicum]
MRKRRLFNTLPTVHGVVFAEPNLKGPESGNPFDSSPILIRLRAIPNLTVSVIKSSLVRPAETPSSAGQIRVPRHVA